MSEIDRIVTSQTTNTTTTSSSTAGGASASSNDVTIFKGSKKKDLTPEEIKLLKSLGIDPNNTAAVEQWRALPQEQRDAQMNQYYMQAEANKSTAPSTQTQPAQTTPAAPAGVTSANTETQAPASSAAATDTPEATGASSPVAATAASSGTLTPAVTSETPQTAVPENADETLQAKTVTQPTAAAQPAAADDVLNASVEMLQLEAIKPASLAPMVDTSPIDPKNLKISFMDILKSTPKEQWKNYSKEERLYLLKNALGDQFKDQLEGLSEEEKFNTINGLIDNAIKAEEGFSDEKWNSFSEAKKDKLRLKYGTTFEIAIKKGYTLEDWNKLTLLDHERDQFENYNEKKETFLQKVENGEIDKSVIENLKLSSVEKRFIKKQEAYSQIYEMSNQLQEISSALNSSKQSASTDATEQKTSYFDNFEAETGLNANKIKTKADKNEYILQLRRHITKCLEGKTKEEREAIYEELIFSVNKDKVRSDLLVMAMKDAKKKGYGDEFMAYQNNLAANIKNLSQEQQDSIKTTITSANDHLNVEQDTDSYIENLTKANVTLGNVKDVQDTTAKLSEARRVHSEHARLLIKTKNPEMQKGLGTYAAKSGDEKLIKQVTRGLAECENGEELTESFKHDNAELQLEQADIAIEANPTSVIVNDSLAKATVYVDKKVANEFFDKGFEATKNLLEDDRIDAQKGWADVIDDCDASVQLGMHKTVLTSEYDEVLEYASSNIFKYDESVQADAIKASYNTGNQKAIDAVNAQLDKCSPKAVEAVGSDVISRQTQATESRYTKEVAQQVAEFNQKYQELTGTAAQDNILPDADEQKMAFVQNFLSATPQEQYKLLSKIPQAWQGTVFSKICQYCPTLLTGLVKQGYGKQILKTPGMPSDVIYKVINTMLTCGAKDKKDASKYVLDHKYLFTESTLERCEEILNGVKGRERKNYSSKPIGGGIQAALQPGMSAIYPDKMDMFYKA